MRRIVLASLLLAAPTAVLADAPRDVKKMTTDDCARARAANKTCVINIEGIDVEGLGSKGQGDRLSALEFQKHASLIRIRMDFIAEILKSAEDL